MEQGAAEPVALEDSIDVVRCEPVLVDQIRPVGDKTACGNMLAIPVDRSLYSPASPIISSLIISSLQAETKPPILSRSWTTSETKKTAQEKGGRSSAEIMVRQEFAHVAR